MNKQALINALFSSLGAFVCIGFLAYLNSSIEEFKYAKNPMHTKAPKELNNALIKACFFINLIVYDKTLFDYPILLFDNRYNWYSNICCTYL